jgi:hypothetical protein
MQPRKAMAKAFVIGRSFLFPFDAKKSWLQLSRVHAPVAHL